VLVVDEGGRGYRFRHALLQEVAACELLPGERARVHHRVAELLESRPAGRGTAEAQRLAEIAHHRLRSDDSATALGAALRAARAAERVHALAEASRNYDAALRLWDRVAEPETIAQVDLAEVLDRAAECRWLGTGDAGGSAELLECALAELGDAAPALRRADLTSRLAMTSWDAHANARAGLPLHEAALGMLDDAPSAIAARVRARFANTLLLLGDFPAAARHAADAVRTARAAGAPSEVADPLITLFVCRSFEGDDAGTVALMEEARGPVLETADARIVKRFFTNAITSLHNFGRYEEALALSAEGIELHNRAGLDYHGKMCMHANAADALCALGRPREAAALLGEADGTFTSDTLLVHLGHAQVALLEGRLEAAAARLERILEVRDVEAMLILPAATLAAEVALWRGDFATALNVLGDGEAAVCEDDWVAAASFFAVSVRAQADSAEGGALGDDTARAEADRVVQRLRQITRQAAVRVPEAHARGLLGEAERSRLDPYPDPAAWHAAAEAFDALGRPYEAAYAHWRHAQAVARAQGPRDELERAAGQAHAKAGAVGARHLVDAAERLARRARVRLPGMAQDAGDTFPDLTAREREVLALIADGRTNRQIAQELFITEKTASVHVSNILGKLGATNRGEAAALAHRAGFEPLPVAR
jgi:DNA-binding CsgD family transcriptional regulator